MSDDFYDSLDDDWQDSKSSCASFYLHQKDSVPAKRVSKLESITRHSSFCFGKVVDKEGLDFSPSCKRVVNHRHNFLPHINKGKSFQGDLNKISNRSIDCAALAEKGLLLNEDGSFTKSPRTEAEQLPFITREYKNLVFQKQKTYDIKKKDAQIKRQKSKMYWKETSKPTTDKLSRKSSSFCLPEKTNDNLTDSMKQKLLQEKNEKNKCHFEILRQEPKYCQSEISQPLNKLSEGTDTGKPFKSLDRQLSQMALNTHKTRLSYTERQQVQKGYSPLFLRYGVKKITSETTRSNFGDSITGKLSEVSSRALSIKSLDESEDEEKFYEEIIKKDKNKMERGNNSGSASRSAAKCGSLRELEKLRGSGKTNFNQGPKPLFIDIKTIGEKTPQVPKKCTRNCPSHPGAKLSKTELVLKGKAYGYMANARNILKFKSQDKLSERENLSWKLGEENRVAYKQDSAFELPANNARNHSPWAGLKTRKKNGSQNAQVSNEERLEYRGYNRNDEKRELYLPHVTISENRNVNGTKLLRKHSCLYGPFC